jgi:hypothetical protein
MQETVAHQVRQTGYVANSGRDDGGIVDVYVNKARLLSLEVASWGRPWQSRTTRRLKEREQDVHQDVG